jgi:hypothetical protein
MYDDSNPTSVRLKNEINNSFDNRTSISFVTNINLIQDENNYLIVIGFLNVPLQTNLPHITGEVFGVKVDSDDNNVTGSLSFYNYRTNKYTGNSVFLNFEMLTGGIISGDYLIYNVNLKQIFLRTKAMAEILAQKSITLKNSNTDQNIIVRYETAYQKLMDIKDICDQLYINPATLNTLKDILLQTIYDLNLQNKKLFMKSSPTIY